jgi:hypothetical protein
MMTCMTLETSFFYGYPTRLIVAAKAVNNAVSWQMSVVAGAT